MRRDLADIRLADRVFAPHYASCVQRVLIAATGLREGADQESAVLTELNQGDVFEVLEFVKGRAWGRAPGAGLVGYVDAAALSWPAE
ncbi:SH3 domain-containing protein [Sphingomonas sp. RB3P16]|uniref:SH3 domain-containing protein n=1 Tax=Parasphingomonas frigoris TaxID=3096163 RepID=UPI002FCA8F4C